MSTAPAPSEHQETILLKYAGDVFCLIATTSLMLVLWDSDKITSFSGKSQVCYATVYTARFIGGYLGDALMPTGSEFLLRITLTSSSYVIIYLIYYKFRNDFSHKLDSFRIGYAFVPCMLLAFLYNPGFSNKSFSYNEILTNGIPFTEIGYAFSYYLEVVAIFPQLSMRHTQNAGRKRDFIAFYLMLMGLSRGIGLNLPVEIW